MFWGLAALNQLPSTFWSVTLQPLGADQPTIHKLKGDMPSYHMRYNGMDSSKWLQRYDGHKRLANIHHVLYLNDWQRERQRLSRACLGHADAVRTGEDLGHAVDLQT